MKNFLYIFLFCFVTNSALAGFVNIGKKEAADNRGRFFLLDEGSRVALAFTSGSSSADFASDAYSDFSSSVLENRLSYAQTVDPNKSLFGISYASTSVKMGLKYSTTLNSLNLVYDKMNVKQNIKTISVAYLNQLDSKKGFYAIGVSQTTTDSNQSADYTLGSTKGSYSINAETQNIDLSFLYNAEIKDNLRFAVIFQNATSAEANYSSSTSKLTTGHGHYLSLGLGIEKGSTFAEAGLIYEAENAASHSPSSNTLVLEWEYWILQKLNVGLELNFINSNRFEEGSTVIPARIVSTQEVYGNFIQNKFSLAVTYLLSRIKHTNDTVYNSTLGNLFGITLSSTF